MEYAGLMAVEVGKTRLEALGEVEEAADLIRYYAKTAEDNAFYDHPMDNLGDAAVHTRTILRPHGVFAVISPFNFPMALAVGPSCAAMMAGNTVVFKPASASAMTAIAILEAYRDAGVPDGVFNLVMGPGDTVGDELQHNPGIDGIVFTGSYEVGFELFRNFSSGSRARASSRWAARTRRSSSARADLEEAAEGIMRSAFGFGGQKCSANSRVYVEQPVHDELVRLLVEKTEKLTVGDPLPRPAFLGPVIDAARRRAPPAGRRRRAPGRHRVHRRRAPDRRRPRPRLLRRADGRRPAAGVASPVPGRAVRAVHGGPRGGLAGRGAHPRQRERLRADRGRVLDRPGRGPAVPRRDRGGRPVRQPAGRGDDGRVAGRPGVRRLEGLRARPARRACRCTTSRSSCGSRATPSSTDRCGRSHRRSSWRLGSSPAARSCPRRATCPSTSFRSG